MKCPDQNQLSQALNEAHEKLPEKDSWGLFAYSDAPPVICGSGIGAFSWFDSRIDMIEFVAENLAWWHPAPSSMEPMEIATGVKAILKETDPTIADLEQLRSDLNEFMQNMWQIEWWGQFQDLCEGAGEFPTKIRGSFCENNDVPEAISENRIRDFGEYMRNYGF